MSRNCFQSMDLDQVRSALAQLHQQVIEQHGRIEITRADCQERCVLISQRELIDLERALEILSASESAELMRGELTRVAQDLSVSSEALATR